MSHHPISLTSNRLIGLVTSMTDVMNVGPMQQVAWFAPMAVGGLFIASVGGLVLHRLSGTVTILVAGAAWVVPPLLFALAPPGAGYWPWVFPGMVCTAIATDTTFTVSNVFVSSPPRYIRKSSRLR